MPRRLGAPRRSPIRARLRPIFLSLALLVLGVAAWIALARRGEALNEAFHLRTQLLDEVGAARPFEGRIAGLAHSAIVERAVPSSASLRKIERRIRRRYDGPLDLAVDGLELQL